MFEGGGELQLEYAQEELVETNCQSAESCHQCVERLTEGVCAAVGVCQLPRPFYDQILGQRRVFFEAELKALGIPLPIRGMARRNQLNAQLVNVRTGQAADPVPDAAYILTHAKYALGFRVDAGEQYHLQVVGRNTSTVPTGGDGGTPDAGP